MTPWAVACQAPLSMGSSRQEYWSGLPFPSPGDLPNPVIKHRSPALQADSLLVYTRHAGNDRCFFLYFLYKKDKLGLIKKVLSHLLLAFLIRKRFQKVFDSTERKEQMKNVWYFPEHQNFLPQIQSQLHNEGATQPSCTSYC